jgi:hypothetical protein
VSKGFDEVLEGLPTMSQFGTKSQCEAARLRHMFDAGRESGMREAAGIASRFGLIDNPVTSQIYHAILTAIASPQEEDVCVWGNNDLGHVVTGCKMTPWTISPGAYCPYCGKKIKLDNH